METGSKKTDLQKDLSLVQQQEAQSQKMTQPEHIQELQAWASRQPFGNTQEMSAHVLGLQIPDSLVAHKHSEQNNSTKNIQTPSRKFNMFVPTPTIPLQPTSKKKDKENQNNQEEQ